MGGRCISNAFRGLCHSMFPVMMEWCSLVSWQMLGGMMGKPLLVAHRQRVVDFGEEGRRHRSAAAQCRDSITVVQDRVLLKRATGALVMKPQGNGGGRGKLERIAVKLTQIEGDPRQASRWLY